MVQGDEMEAPVVIRNLQQPAGHFFVVAQLALDYRHNLRHCCRSRDLQNIDRVRIFGILCRAGSRVFLREQGEDAGFPWNRNPLDHRQRSGSCGHSH